MKIILDTNVIIAAFATHGLCHSVFELCIDQYEIFTSQHIIEEVEENLSDKFKMPKGVVFAVIENLRENSTLAIADELAAPICRDPDDDRILGFAHSTQSEFIITGDRDLLSLKTFENTKIVTPREFWENVRRGDSKRSVHK
jgi:putative PIN family toxin of toxin-antitoxin system